MSAFNPLRTLESLAGYGRDQSLILNPLVLLAAAALVPAHAGPVILDHVTVIDGSGAVAKPDMRVEIRGSRIASITPSAKSSRKQRYTIDARGKYLIPGLWDFHVHTGQREIYLPLYIANGITGVRDMGGDLEVPTGYSSIRYVNLNLWRQAIEAGPLVGPRMILAGYLIDGYSWPGNVTVKTPEEGREAVAALQRIGVDFIKVKSDLSRASYFAIADEAKRRHLVLAGHVPNSVGAAEASAAGQKSIEHLNGIALGASADEPQLMAELESAVEAQDRDRYNRIEAQVDTSFNERKAASLFAKFARNRTWQVPTLVELRASVLGFSADQPRWKYMPETLRTQWRRQAGLHDVDASRHHFAALLRLTKKMADAGVEIIAGTDTANPSLVPGFSLHDELGLLVSAGLTPIQALQSATINPARYLGRQRDLGTIQVGKIADLVLLNSNPLDDIRHTQDIEAVIVNGRFLDRKTLDQMLHDVELAAASE